MTTPRPPPPTSQPGRRRVRDVVRPHRRSFMWGLLWLLTTNALAVVLPRLVNVGVEGIREGRGLAAMLGLAGLLAGTALAMGITRVLSRICVFNVGRDVEYALRRDLYVHLCAQPPAFFQSHPVGDLVSRSTSDLSHVRLMFGFATLNIINTAVVYLGNVPLLFQLDVPLALAVLAPYPGVVVLIRVLVKRVFAHTKVNQEDQAALSTRVQEHLAGLSVVRALAAEEDEQRRFADVNRRVYRSSVQLARTRNLMGPAMALLGTGSALVATWYGAYRVMEGHVSVGDLVEFNTRLAMLAWPTLAVGWILAIWQRGRASLGRINDVLAVVPSVASPGAAREPKQRDGAVTLRGVGTRVEGGRWTLQDVDVAIPARGFVGIVGATGSGKSTLAALLPRLRDPDVGSVAVDGVDVRERSLTDLRQDVTVAPQEAFLFSASVLENLRLGRPSATPEEISAVVDLLALETDLAALPMGLQTVVGERGITLSGGQRQRVALGRALLCQPRVLVLDDSLSALDAETEARILGRLRSHTSARTLVVISHRLSAVQDADEILVLEAGRIVERGLHAELMRRGGAYAGLWGRERATAELERLERTLEAAP